MHGTFQNIPAVVSKGISLFLLSPKSGPDLDLLPFPCKTNFEKNLDKTFLNLEFWVL